MKRITLCAIAAAAMSGGASAQVVINEVFENPTGSGSVDDVWEYIELYGKPGLDLTGYAVALVMGGTDDGDDVPGPLPIDFDDGDHVPEIDEVFYLDGMSIGANGFLVLHNTNAGGFSNIVSRLPAETARAAWKTRHVPSPHDPQAGRLRNDGSSTFVLLRRRPDHSINEMGQSVYGAGYAWWKDENPDVDFDGMIDCGMETPVNAEGPVVVIPAAVGLDPYQMVDDVAWSNAGGKEYVRSSQQEFSNTDGFNPDAASRVGFYVENPMLGHRFDSMGAVVDSRMADEEFIFGEVPVLTGATGLAYDPTPDVDGFPQAKGPTDQGGPAYDGTCNPDDPGASCAPAPGPFLFEDIDVSGFVLTPGDFNDLDRPDPAADIVQFRFVAGDVNLDGALNDDDLSFICAFEGRSLDETAPVLCADGVTMIDGYVFQGRAFQQILTMTCQSTTDADPTVVSREDVNALRTMLGYGDIPDQNNDGVVNSSDLAQVLGAWGTGSPAADVNCDGVVNSSDLALVLGAWG